MTTPDIEPSILKIGLSLYSVFVFVIFMESINIIQILMLARKEVLLDILKYARQVAFPVVICLCFEGILFLFAGKSTAIDLTLLFLAEFVPINIVYRFAMTDGERGSVRKIVNTWNKKR